MQNESLEKKLVHRTKDSGKGGINCRLATYLGNIYLRTKRLRTESDRMCGTKLDSFGVKFNKFLHVSNGCKDVIVARVWTVHRKKKWINLISATLSKTKIDWFEEKNFGCLTIHSRFLMCNFNFLRMPRQMRRKVRQNHDFWPWKTFDQKSLKNEMIQNLEVIRL